MAITKAKVLGPYLYSEMDTMSGALVSQGSALSGQVVFSINSPKQFWVCVIQEGAVI